MYFSSLFVLAYGRLYLLNDVQYLIVTSANKIKIKNPKTSTNAKLYERRKPTLAKDKRMDIQIDERPSHDGNDCSCAQRRTVINIKHR